MIKNTNDYRIVRRHNQLPIYMIGDGTFFKCREFSHSSYGKTISMLHAENLKNMDNENPLTQLFPGEKLSYWSSKKKCAREKNKAQASSNSVITFEAYDDASAFCPTTDYDYGLYVVDGNDPMIYKILDKTNKKIGLNEDEKELMKTILDTKPDGIAYSSELNMNTDFIFFERGFDKLSLKTVHIRIDRNNAKEIYCAISSDYNADCKSYGYYFEPVLRKKYDASYEQSEEYLRRKSTFDSNLTTK